MIGFDAEGKPIDPSKKREQPKQIKCPFCGEMFFPHMAEKSSSTGGNIVRGAVFLPWGIVSALKKGIVCPHCKMKIKQ